MSRRGTAPRATPVGWVRLPGGHTIRWRRGDRVAHVLRDQQMDNHGMAGVVDTITVSPSGWTDLAEIRQVGRRWLHQHRNQQSTHVEEASTRVARISAGLNERRAR